MRPASSPGETIAAQQREITFPEQWLQTRGK
jgi:hypothetical protein